MKTFTEQLENLYEIARVEINEKIRKSKDESKSYSVKIIKITDDQLMFNLEGGRYLTEISEENLIDNEGYLYNYCVLPYEDFMELTDWVKTIKQEKPTETTLESIINTIEEHHSIDEYEEDGELCGYEINTYTSGGVNMIIFLDFRNSEYNPKNPTHFLKVFEDRIESIDINEEIVLHREMKDYTNNFTLSESLEDFNDWRDDLNKLIEKL